jgi:hypothetical protein
VRVIADFCQSDSQIMHDRNDSGRNAAALLASVLVIVGGLFACVMIALVFAQKPMVPLSACVLYLSTVVLMLWLGRERPRSQGGVGASVFQFLRTRKHEDYVPHYKPRRRRGHVNQVFGTNDPPTAETVREIADTSRNWVPSDRNLKK